MVVFRIFSNLVRMALGVIFLPLRLIGVPLAIVMLPIRLIMHNLPLVMIVIVTIVVYRAFTGEHSGSSMNQLRPAVSAPKQAKNRGNGPIIINPVTKVEDGDSAFATDVYATMSDEERAAYSSAFFWAMSNITDTQTHTWSSYNIAGSLRPESTFTNKAGVTCRRFSEVLKVHEVQQTITGTACANGNGSWCKLKPNATPSCNLGQPSRGLLDSISGSLQNLF